MQMDIQCRSADPSEELREYAMRRMAYCLSHGEAHIGRVIVQLSGIVGPGGGEDKRCRLELQLRGLPDLVVEDTQADYHRAIDRAAGRAGRTLARRLALGEARDRG